MSRSPAKTWHGHLQSEQVGILVLLSPPTSTSPSRSPLSAGSRRPERKTGDQFGSVRSVLAPPLNLAFGFEILSSQGLQLPDQSFLIVQQKAVSKTGSIWRVMYNLYNPLISII